MTTGLILKQFSRIIVIAAFYANPIFAQLNSNNLTQYTEADGLPGSQASCIFHESLLRPIPMHWLLHASARRTVAVEATILGAMVTPLRVVVERASMAVS